MFLEPLALTRVWLLGFRLCKTGQHRANIWPAIITCVSHFRRCKGDDVRALFLRHTHGTHGNPWILIDHPSLKRPCMHIVSQDSPSTRNNIGPFWITLFGRNQDSPRLYFHAWCRALRDGPGMCLLGSQNNTWFQFEKYLLESLKWVCKEIFIKILRVLYHACKVSIGQISFCTTCPIASKLSMVWLVCIAKEDHCGDLFEPQRMEHSLAL